jgi:hypothetical protein
MIFFKMTSFDKTLTEKVVLTICGLFPAQLLDILTHYVFEYSTINWVFC